MTVNLQPYSSAWPAIYLDELRKLREFLPGEVFAIDHIGSTAISGMTSKPIIDIIIGVTTLKDIEPFVADLSTLNYIDKGSAGVTGRRFFAKNEGQPIACYIHVAPGQSDYYRDKIIFRDYLRRYSEVAKQHAALKQKLAADYPNDRNSYTEAKQEFVTAVLNKAKAETPYL